MSNTQKLGGYASLVTAIVFVAILVVQFGVIGPQGGGPTATPEASFAVASRLTTVYLVTYLFNVMFAITSILGALAVRERLSAGAPNRMRLSVIAASIAGALFLANGIISFSGLPGLVAAQDATGYRLIGIVVNGLLNAAIFAVGGTVLLQGWAGLATKGLPTGLSYILLLAGIFAVLSFLVPILGLLGVVVNVIWALWLGYVLLSKPAPLMAKARPAI